MLYEVITRPVRALFVLALLAWPALGGGLDRGHDVINDGANVHGDRAQLALGDQPGELLEDVDKPTYIAAHNRREMLAEIGIVVPLADQLDEGRITSYNVCYTKLLRGP